jgi:DNA-directed RNA polymerase specialized sigma24 family protein
LQVGWVTPVGESAFAEAWGEIAAQVSARCRQLSRDAHEAQELYQLTAIRAWRGHASFRGESGYLTWVMRILDREAARLASSRNRIVSREMTIDPQAADDQFSANLRGFDRGTESGDRGGCGGAGWLAALLADAAANQAISATEHRGVSERLAHPDAAWPAIGARLGMTATACAVAHSRAVPKLRVFQPCHDRFVSPVYTRVATRLPVSRAPSREVCPMPTNTSQTLPDQIKRQREEMQRDALGAMGALAAVAARHLLDETAKALTEDADGLKSETFKMIVMGRFKNGKSTLINALMGGTTKPVDLGGAQGPMVVDDLPATAVVSQVSYADVPFIRAVKTDESVTQWTLPQYLRDSTIGDDDDETRRRFDEIKQFEIGYPARLCESQVVLYDSPGLDENPLRTRITMDAVHRCDTALMVFSSSALLGQSELVDDTMVRNDGTHVFVVINLFNNKQVDDKLRGYVWNKYVRDHLNGPAWAGQDPADYDIYFVNAKMAVDARYGGAGPAAEQVYRDSGLAAFEQRLGRFLIDERFVIHITTFSKKAINPADKLLQYLSQQQAAVVADRDRFRAAWAAKQPKLEELRTRPKRLPPIVSKYRNDAIIDLTSGVTAAIAGIRRDLPGHLEAATLPTQEAKTFAVWHQKKLTEEAVTEINSFISRRLASWSEDEADARMRDIASRLNEEIRDEVAQIGSDYDDINVALTGWDNAKLGTLGNVHSTTERVTAAIAGLLFGDLSAAVGGGAGGYRGALGGILGAGAASWLLIGVLGITSGLVLVPILAIALLGSAITGSAGLVRRIKANALKAADDRLALLPSEATAQIANGLRARFDELQTVITSEVTAFIDEEERNINAQVQKTSRGRQTRSARCASLGPTSRRSASTARRWRTR